LVKVVTGSYGRVEQPGGEFEVCQLSLLFYFQDFLFLLAHIHYGELFLKGLAMAAKIGGHT
jgi:hypothetical protein